MTLKLGSGGMTRGFVAISLLILASISEPAAAQVDDICLINGDVTFSGSFVPAVGASNVACGGGAGAPSFDDDWYCDGPHTITFTDDWEQANERVGLRLTGGCSIHAEVEDSSPSAFSIAFGQKGLNMKLPGEGGPERNTGGTFTSLGKYLSHHQATPTVYGAPTDESANSNGYQYFQVGEILPCGDGDCSTNVDQVTFSYPAGTWGVSEVGTQPRDLVFGNNLDAFVGTDDLAAGDEQEADVVCIWDLDPDDDYWAPEAGFCYTVISADGTSEPRTLTLSVLQGEWDTPKRTHAWRAYQPITLSNDVVAGQYEFEIDQVLPDPHGGAFPSEDDPFVGRRVRCQTDSSNGWESHSYLIAHHDDGTIWLIAPREGGTGLLHDYPAGRECVLGYGFQSGDPFYAYRPVVWTASQPTPADDVMYRGTIGMRGMDTTLTATVLWQLQHGIRVIHGDHVWTDIWMRDVWGGHTAASIFVYDVSSASLIRTTTTGGAPNSAPSHDPEDPFAPFCTDYIGEPVTCKCNRQDQDGIGSTTADQHNPNADCHMHHGIIPSGGKDITVTSYVTRHVADDNIAPGYYQSDDHNFAVEVVREQSSPHPENFRLKNLNFQFSTRSGGTGAAFDQWTSDGSGQVTNMICLDCGTGQAPVVAGYQQHWDAPPDSPPVGTPGKFRMDNVVAIGVNGGYGDGGLRHGSEAISHTNVYTNWLRIDKDWDGLQPGFAHLTKRLTNFVMFNNSQDGTRLITNGYLWQGLPNWSNGFVADYEWNHDNIQTPMRWDHLESEVGYVRNVGFLDFKHSTAMWPYFTAFHDDGGGAAAGLEFQNVTLAYTDRVDVGDRFSNAAYHSLVNSTSGISWNGFLMHGFYNDDGWIYYGQPDVSNVVEGGGFCWSANTYVSGGSGHAQSGFIDALVANSWPFHVGGEPLPEFAIASIPVNPSFGPYEGCGAGPGAGIGSPNAALSNVGVRPVTLGDYLSALDQNACSGQCLGATILV
ncbi:MAG: hypothetical protein JRH17_07175, partial [Deltaproteobacteria bacterium]|nr:hypothetical protein [Deltaproteobacteria bacterium]